MFVVIPIKCLGRKAKGVSALEQPVSVEVRVRRQGEISISISVECPYNTGRHGEYCKASYPPGVEKIGKGVSCPYSLDIPYYEDQALVGHDYRPI